MLANMIIQAVNQGIITLDEALEYAAKMNVII